MCSKLYWSLDWKKKKKDFIPGIYCFKLKPLQVFSATADPPIREDVRPRQKAVSLATSRKTSSPVTPQQTNQQPKLHPKITKTQINLKHSSLLFLTQ